MNKSGDRASWLKGPGNTCSNTGPVPRRSFRFILLGAPGIGKGTQAELIQKHLGCCHLSTGDVFRAAKCAEGNLSPAMSEAIQYMQRGELVPDSTVVQMVRERLHCLRCDHGFLLDGFPRTVEQARALDAMLTEAGLHFDAVISYDLDTEKVVERLGGRRTCRGCGRTYHLKNSPPREEGICDSCGGALYQREDDNPDSIRVRLETFRRSTAPLIEYYGAMGMLHRIDADGMPDVVFQRTLDSLGIAQAVETAE